MGKQKFIFQIEAEPDFSVIIKIMNAFHRRGIPFVEMYTNFNIGDERLHFMISVFETNESAMQIQKRLEREFNVVNVQMTGLSQMTMVNGQRKMS